MLDGRLYEAFEGEALVAKEDGVGPVVMEEGGGTEEEEEVVEEEERTRMSGHGEDQRVSL